MPSRPPPALSLSHAVCSSLSSVLTSVLATCDALAAPDAPVANAPAAALVVEDVLGGGALATVTVLVVEDPQPATIAAAAMAATYERFGVGMSAPLTSNQGAILHPP